MVYRTDRLRNLGVRSPLTASTGCTHVCGVISMIESPAVLFTAASAISSYVCWTVLKASSIFDRPGLWDWAAPIGSLVGLALLSPMTIIQIQAAEVTGTPPAAVVRNIGTMWLVIVGLTLMVTIGTEVNELLEKPDGVDDLEERMPDWMWRGLTEDLHGGSEP